MVVDDAYIVYRIYREQRIRLRDVATLRVRGRPVSEVRGIHGVSLVASHGETIGVVGSNGSGKSTLMIAMAGGLPITSGAIYGISQPILLGVNAALKPELSGRRNITIGLLALGLSRKRVDELYDSIVDFSGLGESVERPMRTYSSGMRARLHFAISTAVNPEILLLDEALAVGDADFKERSRERIEKLRQEAATVFVVSHNMNEIRSMCTRALWLRDGELAADGNPEEITAAYEQWVRERGIASPKSGD